MLSFLALGQSTLLTLHLLQIVLLPLLKSRKVTQGGVVRVNLWLEGTSLLQNPLHHFDLFLHNPLILGFQPVNIILVDIPVRCPITC